ncbi:MAG TPA: hypothetical protein PKL73_09330 [Polyangiaceae bacterium]|jgi:hypothetical protein|nr:MAG: hypothetical protein BWY17_01540 [Deltaproteobacteria bacterium ADurb.Bin207]HNS97136.1 hypothetical protein [Polyangiaceae bacterium]HNZ22795.1 hypothetical protein [Polyangiaceae bacterium]HOD22860.1 hypothetical protein [Polyangiaceae bacterium]HOE47693.1 hypothetical protein [Polyangiaceae bacterium]
MIRFDKHSPWLDRAIVLGLYLLAVAVLAYHARQAGIGADESAYLDAGRRVGEWFDRIGSAESSFFTQADRDAVWAPVHAVVNASTLLSALVWHVAFSGFDVLGECVSLRLGTVLLNAFSVPLLYALLTPGLGRKVGGLSVLLWMLVVRAQHEASLANPGVVAMTGSLAVLVAHGRARSAGRENRMGKSAAWMAVAGLLLGVGVAVSHATIVVLLVLFTNSLWLQRKRLREMLRGGDVPVPSSMVFFAIFAPLAYGLATPWLWHDTAARIRPMLVRAFSPGTQAQGIGHTALSLVLSTPMVIVLGALVGIAVTIGPSRWRGWGKKETTGDDETPALLIVGLLTGLGWTWLLPGSMQPKAPLWLFCLPFMVGLAAMGWERALRWGQRFLADPSWRRRVGVGLWVSLAAGGVWLTVGRPLTSSAAFFPVFLGPRVVASSPAGLRLHDGSVVRAFVPLIDELGVSETTVYSPSVPEDVWAGYQRWAGMRTKVRRVSDRERARLWVLDPGQEGGNARLVGAVSRDAVMLVRLYDTR